jgi:ABC-type nitrate/sulfonate/bicarbonate transport system substrate-binding protein
MNRKSTIAGASVVLVIVAIAGLSYYGLQWSTRPAVEPQEVRYGISPYQDLAMPKIAEGLGLYRKNNLNVELVTIAWEDIIPSLASGGKTVDVAIGSVNTFLPRAENINLQGGGDVVFYAPLWVFKGAALMMQPNSGMQPLSAFVAKYPSDRDRAIKEAMLQLRGKTIAVPEGTTFDQMLVAGLKIAGMNPRTDVNIRHVKLDDGVYAFLGHDVDIVGAGVTQRTELMRNGGRVFLDMESFGFAEITGIMTTRYFAAAHAEELAKLVQIWFESVQALFSNVDKQSEYLRAYLDKAASTKYTLEEYKGALEFKEFPRSATEAETLFISTDGTFYWKRNWDIINDFLLETKKITRPIPYEYFMGEKVLSAARQ